MNITKLKIWNDLQSLGFEPINYFGYGRKVAIGCSLRKKLTDISGKDFYTDIITIEPHVCKFSDGKNYHISGEVNKPYTGKFYQYNALGHKEEIYLTVDRINEFYKAKDILTVINTML